MKIAELDKARLAKVRALEEELGTYVVALEPQLPLANLTDEQLERLQAAEAELGVVLLAYRRG
jgi:hypothetical protein